MTDYMCGVAGLFRLVVAYEVKAFSSVLGEKDRANILAEKNCSDMAGFCYQVKVFFLVLVENVGEDENGFAAVSAAIFLGGHAFCQRKRSFV